MPRDAKPVLVIGSLNMDLVAGCELLPLPGTSQTVFGRDFCSVSAQFTAHSMLRRDGTGMVSTINEVDTTDEGSLKPFET
jgi:hypothetical protein